MARPISAELISAIETSIDCAKKAKKKPKYDAIADIFGVSHVTVRKIEKRMDVQKATGIDPRKPIGRPSLANPAIIQAIQELLERRPSLDQSAVSDYVREEFGVVMSQSCISRVLKSTNIPHKRTSNFKLGGKGKILPGSIWRTQVKVRDRRKETQNYQSPYLNPSTSSAGAEGAYGNPMMSNAEATYNIPYIGQEGLTLDPNF